MVIIGVTPAEMENIRFASTIMMVLVSLHTGVAEIVTRPTATEVVVGGSTFLNCSTNSKQEIHWFHTPFGSNQERNLVYGYDQFYSQYIGRFQMEKSEANGAYNLVISAVIIDDAGVYECQDETGRGKKEFAQLIVLDANPVCEPHLATHEIIGINNCGIEPNQLILSCSVDYKGNEAPKMEWRNSRDNTSVSKGVTHATMDNKRVVCNMTINENSIVKDGDSFICSTTRSATSNEGCKSGKIKVKGTASPTCVASDVCKPYIKPYSDAIICIILIVLPIAIGLTILVLWYLRVYKPKKLKQKENKDVITEEMNIGLLKGTAPSQGGDIERGEDGKETGVEFDHTSSQEEFNDDRNINITTLENKLKMSLERIERRDKMIRELKQNDKLSQSEITSLQSDKVELQAKVKDLEQHLYPKEDIDYFDKPVLAHAIALSEGSKVKSGKNNRKSEQNKEESINGITVLGKELFLIKKNCQEIKVYDSKTFQNQRNLEIREMTDPLDLASSKDANCLYIVGRIDKEGESEIVRLDPEGRVLNKWSTGGVKGRLSTYGSNVILCLSDKQLINEYSPDGKLIVTVPLSPAVKLNNPLHAIKVTSAHFVVSHGDLKDELHRVCVVDLDGNIKKQCTTWEKIGVFPHGTKKVPICLLENDERSVIVAELENNRILLLNSMLKYQRKLVDTGKGKGDYPVRLCFDDTQSRLFVAVNKRGSDKEEWTGGRILIFNIK